MSDTEKEHDELRQILSEQSRRRATPTLYEYTLLSGDAEAVNAQLRELIGETWEPLFLTAGTVASGDGRYTMNSHLLMRRELR